MVVIRVDKDKGLVLYLGFFLNWGCDVFHFVIYYS